MRTVHLVRHAAAARAAAGVRDHGRPLTRRGRETAGRLGADLRTVGIVPDLVLCSTARRARETLEHLGLQEVEQRFDRGLYDADAGDLLEHLRGVADSVHDVLVVGHNPAVHEVTTTLAGSGNGSEPLAAGFPPGALATVTAPVGSWIDLGPGGAQLARFLVPDD